ncbi:hypothetical protein GWK47_044970 [Chionoecetes opilio]|uniref:HAT C-terminal dimerisation domain-containing protein n=1 Tax=Chionoecetes opilio TaxID=41210 RepID=A0A8J4YEG6_CHIOP|nr:hypothetical protein GWK47_044970 [Chionoecetes opilio]
MKEKAQALWHKHNRKPTTTAITKREVGRKLRTPNATLWNSLYGSMEDLTIHPLFKLPVVRLLNPEKVDALKIKMLCKVKEKAVLDILEGNSQMKTKRMIFSRENNLLEQAMFPALFRAAWADVFVKYKTAIPSSAAVDRLFSQGSDIMKAKRASLTSNSFEGLAS